MKSLRSLSLLALGTLVAVPAFAQTAPGAPQNLTRVVNGTTVTLNWTPPTTGGLPTSYLVEAAFAPGGPMIASLPTTTTSVTVPNVPSGLYYVRVRAVNSGGQSMPSSEVTVAVTGGCPAPPLPPVLTVRASGLAASATWTSAGGCAPTSYVLIVGSGPGLGNIAQVNMGAGTALAANAPPGVYYVRLVGSNAFGTASSEELTARIAVNSITDTIQAFGAISFDITLTATGTYQGTLVWNDPTIDLDLYLARPGCPYPPTGCTLVISDGVGVNTERVSMPVRTGETYRLWVDNLSNRRTSFTISNAVTTGEAPDAREFANDSTSPRKLKPHE